MGVVASPGSPHPWAVRLWVLVIQPSLALSCSQPVKTPTSPPRLFLELWPLFPFIPRLYPTPHLPLPQVHWGVGVCFPSPSAAGAGETALPWVTTPAPGLPGLWRVRWVWPALLAGVWSEDPGTVCWAAVPSMGSAFPGLGCLADLQVPVLSWAVVAESSSSLSGGNSWSREGFLVGGAPFFPLTLPLYHSPGFSCSIQGSLPKPFSTCRRIILLFPRNNN